MTYIVDASVTLKLVIQESGSDRARALIAGKPLSAPELMWQECANVLWVKARRGQIARDHSQLALEALLSAPIARLSTHDLIQSAHSLALTLDHPVYDCLYLAAAIRENALLVSADARFIQAARTNRLYAGRVDLL